MSGFTGFPGGGGGGGVGPGTLNYVAKFTGANTIGDSTIIDGGAGVQFPVGGVTILTPPVVFPLIIQNAVPQNVFTVDPAGNGQGNSFTAQDPTGGRNAYVGLGPGSAVPVSAPANANIRFNEFTNKVELSEAGGPYTPIFGGGVTWDAIGNPVANQFLNMGGNTSAWTWTGSIGAAFDALLMQDTVANLGTGYMLDIVTASLGMKPFHVKAQAVDAITVLASGAVGIGTAAPGAFALDVNGNARIQGKLTVTGLIDPTALELTDPAFQNCYISMTDGSGATPVAGKCFLRYLPGVNNYLEVSINGSAFVPIASQAGGAAATASAPLFLTTGNLTLGTAAVPTTADANADVIWGSSAVGKKPLVLQALAGQTANILEAQASTGAVVAAIQPNGSLTVRGVAYTWPAADGAAGTFLQTNGAGLLSWAAGGGGGVTSVTASTPLTSSGGATPNIALGTAAAPTTADANADVIWGTSATTKKALVLQGLALQTADLQQWQDSTGAVLAFVNAAGSITAPSMFSKLFDLSDVATTSAYMAMQQGESAAVSGGGTGRLRYNSSTNKFQFSENAGGWTNCFPTGGAVGGTGTIGTLPKWSAAQTLTDSIVTEALGVLTVTTGSGPLTVGLVDAFSRPNLWWHASGGAGCLVRLGSNVTDGDPSNVDSDGIVMWRPSDNTACRIKTDRFGLTTSLNSGIYTFRVDNTNFSYRSVAGGGTFRIFIDKATGFTGFGTNTALAAEQFRVTGGTSQFDSALQIGVPSTTQSPLVLANTSAFTVSVQSSNTTAASWTMTLPINTGTNGQVLTTDGTGITSWTTVASGSATWDAILAPVGAQSLSMAAYTTTWTWNATTGAGVNLFTMTDTAANTGTGYLFNAFTAAGSALKPFHVGANGVDAITVLASGAVGIGTNAPGAFALDVAGTLNVQGNETITGGNLTVKGVGDVAVAAQTTNGASLNIKSISENVTLSTIAAFTDSVGNLLPANAYIVVVTYRVTTAITGPVTAFDVGTAADTTRFGTGIALAGGTHSSSFKEAIPLNPSMQNGASAVRITLDGIPTAGAVRVTVYYMDCDDPTS